MSAPEVSPELLTQKQVCQRLGVSQDTFIRWRKTPGIVLPDPVPMPSGRLKWRVEDIDAMVRRRAVSLVSSRRQYFRHARTVSRGAVGANPNSLTGKRSA